MSKTFKKVISVTTSATTILWLSGIAALAPLAAMAATINEGDTIRVANTFDVYIAKYVGAKKFKRLILSPSVFNSYGHLSWSAIKTVTQAEMDAFTTSTLVRAVGDPKVYSLVPTPNSDSGSKQWVNMTAEAFTAAGYDWDSVYEINTVDRDTYTAGADITGGTSASPSTSPSTSTAAGAVTVALASDTPAAGVAVAKAARVPFTKIALTAGASDVSITAITAQRTGLAADAALSSVALIDNATNLQVGLNQTLNASHQVVVRETITIPANTTKYYTLAANMPAVSGTSYAGQVASLALVAVETIATVSGTLPITGNGQTINESLSIGTFSGTAGSLNVSTTTKAVGTTNFNFSGLKLTAGSVEDVTIYSIRFNQSGSAAASDLANVVVSDGTTKYATTVSSDGKYYTASFGTAGLLIGKGLSKEFTVNGDVVGGSARTIKFDIYRATDIVVKGTARLPLVPVLCALTRARPGPRPPTLPKARRELSWARLILWFRAKRLM
ncbi:MAG: Envelope glycoprotein J [Parcubacteria group bacterium GW2011_GWA2_43_9b]|nr:MAG: Envelope glycoprotein J [Parcubacteria group bacterium GW2011_GWA2_43_9b]